MVQNQEHNYLWTGLHNNYYFSLFIKNNNKYSSTQPHIQLIVHA